MKKIYLFFTTISVFGIVSSCSIDNYDSPDASLFGTAIDSETNEPIIQEIFNGSEIDITELGYSTTGTTSTRYLNFKTDGSYQDNNFFNGRYAISAKRTNFSLVTDTIEIKGATKYDFNAKPYIRIKNVEYAYDYAEGEINFTFNLQPTVDEKIVSACVAVDKNPNVSYNMNSSGGVTNVNLNRFVEESDEINITVPTTEFDSGDEYYFRVGSLINVSEAKRNYSDIIKIKVDNSQVSLVEKGVLFDDCESTNGWGGGRSITLDKDNKKKGDASISTTGGGVVIFQKIYDTPFNTQVTEENGHFLFYLYVSSTDFQSSGDSQIELTSSGACDQQEYHWALNSLNLKPGWNKLDLRFSEATKSGNNQDLSAINFIRIYQTSAGEDVTFKLDQLRFYKDGD